jgi:hypothetical protein
MMVSKRRGHKKKNKTAGETEPNQPTFFFRFFTKGSAPHIEFLSYVFLMLSTTPPFFFCVFSELHLLGIELGSVMLQHAFLYPHTEHISCDRITMYKPTSSTTVDISANLTQIFFFFGFTKWKKKEMFAEMET